MAKQKYSMTEEKYLIRNIFLESIAGVPGMVGGMLRHLRSLRRMRRDNGWYVDNLAPAPLKLWRSQWVTPQKG